MGNFFQNVQGRPDDMGVRQLRRRVAFNQTGFATAKGVQIGAIEKGGVVLRAYAIKNTPFSAGATLTLGNDGNTGTGQTANVAGFMATGDTAATTAGYGMVGNAQNQGGPNMAVEMPNDTGVFAYLGGTAATAGDVTFIVEYAPAYPWSDLNGGQAQ